MTDNEIIKAFECCATDVRENTCPKCAFHKKHRCSTLMLNAASDLINRQKAEIERLQTRNDELNILNKTAAQEAIKEFAERLKQNINESIGLYWDEIAGGYYLAEDVIDDIDNLVQEMTEV